MDYKIMLIMVNMAVVGIITSFFLKRFNSILKVFAGALELACSALLSYLIFDIPVYANTILSILIVSIAILLYTMNPVNASSANACQESPIRRTPNPLQINAGLQQLNVMDLDSQIRPTASTVSEAYMWETMQITHIKVDNII